MQKNTAAEYIKAHVTMPDVIARYHHLGAHRARTSCPIHGGEHDNLGYDEAVFHCFTCHASGDVIDFVAQLNKCTFAEAVKIIDADFGLGLESMSEAERLEAERRREERERAEELRRKLAKANGDAFRAFRNYLWELRTRPDSDINPVVKVQLGWADRQIDMIMEDKHFKYPYHDVENSIARAREAVNAWVERNTANG